MKDSPADNVAAPAAWLMAHRGCPAEYPENSLPGVRAVLEAGARHVEFDVQITRDGVPVVAHDDLLIRITGGPGSVTELSLAELQAIPAGEPGRFGERFATVRFPTLAEMLALLEGWPHATAYVELKRASMRRFGREAVVGPVLELLNAHRGDAVALSFDAEMAAQARRRGARRIGLVIKPWDETNREAVHKLAPEFVFVDAGIVPAGERPFWRGSWQWVVYDVNDPALALDLRARGADLIETDRFLQFRHDPRFVERRRDVFRDDT